MELIRCAKCKELKDSEFFRIDNKKRNGLKSYCKQCEANNCKIWLSRNLEKNKQTCKNNYIKNREIRNINSRINYENNREKYIKLAVEYEKERKKIDPYYYFYRLLKDRIRKSFKRYSANGKAKSCTEYGIDFVEIYNKLGPRPGNNYHLDHIIPLTEFDLTIPEHIKLANSPDNLQWIVDIDNRKKHTKIINEIETNTKLKEIWEIIKKDRNK